MEYSPRNASQKQAFRVPKMLTSKMKKNRVKCCRKMLAVMNGEESCFYWQLMKGYKTWIHQWNPESKQESMVWERESPHLPVEFNTASTGKVMATILLCG